MLAFSEDPMEVYRGNAIKYNAIVFNFHVDESNNKWVGTADGLFRSMTPSLASPGGPHRRRGISLRLPGGNADIRWKTESLTAITDISTAKTSSLPGYDPSKKNCG